MDKAEPKVTSRLYQYYRAGVRAVAQVQMQIITALVFAILMLAIAFAPVGNSQATSGSTKHNISNHHGVVLAEDEESTPTPEFPPCLGAPTPTPSGQETQHCDPNGGGGGGYGDPKGG